MATAQQLLQRAKTTLDGRPAGSYRGPSGAPDVRGANTQGTRGTPGRGGVAARPQTGGGVAAGSTGGAVKRPDTYGGGPAPISGRGSVNDTPTASGPGGPATRTFPGFKPRMAPDGINRLTPDGKGQTLIGPGGGVAPPSFGVRMPVDPVVSADLMAKLSSGREPGGPAVEPGAPAGLPGTPLWKQIQDLGGQGTGSFAGNRALLAKLQGANAGGPTVASGGDTAVAGAPGVGGGPVPPPPPGADMAVAPSPGGMAAGFPAFRPRGPMGGGVQARPMPGGPATAGPEPGGPQMSEVMPPPTAATMPGTIPNETPGAGGFDAIGRIGAGLARRRLAGPAAY